MSKKNEIKKKKNKVLRIQKMTIQRLKTFKGFEAYNDNKAQEIIQELEEYAKIVIRHIIVKKRQ